MKIAIPTADYPPIEGGIGTVTLQLSRELAALGHEVTVIAPYFPDMESFDAAEPVEVVRFKGYDRGWLRFFPMRAAARPYVAAADWTIAINVAYGGVIAWRSARPFVTLAYGYEFLKFKNAPLVSGLLRKVYAASQAVAAISTYTRDALVEFGVDANKIEIVLPGAPKPLPVTPEEIAAVKDRHARDFDKVILAVGRFIPRKGHETLIEAMPAILEDHPGAGLVLVGRGPRMEPARELAERLGIGERVTFTGYVPDEELAALYACCDLFALPTGEAEQGHVEGFGLVFSEAHAWGKPVVAGRSGGTVDAVIDGETGLIVAPNDPAATAEAILALLGDPQRAKALGEAGRERVERELNWTVFTRRLEAIMEARS